jgi:hypothetical protein
MKAIDLDSESTDGDWCALVLTDQLLQIIHARLSFFIQNHQK